MNLYTKKDLYQSHFQRLNTSLCLIVLSVDLLKNEIVQCVESLDF